MKYSALPSKVVRKSGFFWNTPPVMSNYIYIVQADKCDERVTRVRVKPYSHATVPAISVLTAEQVIHLMDNLKTEVITGTDRETEFIKVRKDEKGQLTTVGVEGATENYLGNYCFESNLARPALKGNPFFR